MRGSSALSSPSALRWPPAPAEVRLAKDEIHLWCAALGDFHEELPRFHSTLSPDERGLASRLNSCDDRDAFVMRRGILRELLGHYLGRDAATIEFSYGPFGKPDVAGIRDDGPLYFNASRSGALVVYAVTSACPVGVDLERLRPVLELDYIASRFFTPLEASSLMALSPDRQVEGFFLRWTGKEALAKATGEGIGRESHPSGAWKFQFFQPAAGYVGTLAHRAEGARVLRLRVSNSLLNRRSHHLRMDRQ